MRKFLNVLMVAAVAATLSSCGNKNQTVSLKIYADTANYFAKMIADIESQADMNDVDLFLQMQDSANAKRRIADKVLESLFEEKSDTIFLPFEQTKNDEKVEILSVWITGMKFDKLLIEARVKAIDNSSFMGPHVGLVVKDKSKNLLEVGGGIQGPTEEKMDAGNVYIFSGQVEHLHLLSNFRSLVFNEEIKKW